MALPENTSRLRHDIDSGKTGDKVAFTDPAAAPLGTDAEAGGRSPTPAEVALDGSASLQAPDRRGEWGDLSGVWVYLVVAGAVALAILLMLPLGR
jgi:hypothetical protein